MNITKILKEKKPAISFEFFPPKNETAEVELYENIKKLAPLSPSYVSVTYGAGGSSKERTENLVVKLQKLNNISVVAHLTCVGASKDETYQLLEKYAENGVQNILALRGDLPQGSKEYVKKVDGFPYASDLVSFIKKHFPKMGVGVAGFPEGHPETPNRLKEMEYLKYKVDAGADYICTQLFFDNRDFYDYQERCKLANINIPIIAGIMPIISKKGMLRMAELALGARFPSKLMKAINRAENDELTKKVGIHWATEQVRDLIDHNVSGVHFYTLNKSQATLDIYRSLGISSSERLYDQSVQ